jgi:D-serine deaminase-like pyridoxal phosphate-dependent protein
VSRSTALALRGVAGYEGTIAHDRESVHLAAVREFVDSLRGLAEALFGEGLLPAGAILTAGGSLYFDLVAERLAGDWSPDARPLVVLRSGCYLTHDSGVYERSSPFADAASDGRFLPALEVWGAVLSRPEPGLALVGLGKRDVPQDLGFPVASAVRRPDGVEDLGGSVEVLDLNDQHAFCRLAAGTDLGVGELVRFGISHPCTAFDRWRVIPVLDDEDRVVDAVATFF